MNIEWNYNYYQPWSDNEWLVDEMLALLDKDITIVGEYIYCTVCHLRCYAAGTEI